LQEDDAMVVGVKAEVTVKAENGAGIGGMVGLDNG
jgi:hypothetical protein